MKTALISVYNKKGIVDFARQLTALGWDIIASEGTAKELAKAGIKARDVASLVNGGPILGHRVVTLSREIHAGLLAQDNEKDNEELKILGIPRIDLVCVDLYPLRDEMNNADNTVESIIEKTDIGGPAILRSAAKGRRIAVCDPQDRQQVIDWLKSGCPDEDKFISELTAKAEFICARYSLDSAEYHGQGRYSGLVGNRILTCGYGENAWQTPAALYSAEINDPLSLANFQVIQGVAPSYNNLCDLDRLLQTVTHIAAVFDLNYSKTPAIAVGVKHGNPCGAAVGADPAEVLQKMLGGDLRAIFGGVVMVNFSMDKALAEILLTHQMPKGQRRLLDSVAALSFSEKCVEMLKRKNDKCRLLANSALSRLNRHSLDIAARFRYVRGGFLRQPNYDYILNLKNIKKTKQASQNQENDLLLAWAVGSTSNSNTITLASGNKLIGNGVGQQDRVGCCELAVKRAKDAGHETKKAVAYSDSFFPFTDGLQILVDANISAILATSGSIHDNEIIKFCEKNSIILYLVPDKQARGFFGH